MATYKVRGRRSSRVSDAVVQNKPAPDDQPLHVPGVFHVTVTDRGRLVLPAEIRERLEIRDGDRVALILETDGTVSLKTREVALSNLEGMFKHLAPKGHFASDDLIAERRRQARLEDREFRERSPVRRMKREREKRP